MRPARTRLTSHPVPATRQGARPGAVGAGAAPSMSGSTAIRRAPGVESLDNGRLRCYYPCSAGWLRTSASMA